MPNLVLEATDGARRTFFIDEGHYKEDDSGNLLSFSIVYDDGEIEHYFLSEPGTAQKIINYFDEIVSSNPALQRAIGQVCPIIGKKLHPEHGKIVAQIVHFFGQLALTHSAAPFKKGQHYYYNSEHKRAFHYPARLQ